MSTWRQIYSCDSDRYSTPIDAFPVRKHCDAFLWVELSWRQKYPSDHITNALLIYENNSDSTLTCYVTHCLVDIEWKKRFNLTQGIWPICTRSLNRSRDELTWVSPLTFSRHLRCVNELRVGAEVTLWWVNLVNLRSTVEPDSYGSLSPLFTWIFH